MTSKTNLTFRVPPELKEQFQKEASANGTTVTALFHQWMREYVSGKKLSTDSTDDVGAKTGNGTALTARVEAIEQELNRLKASLPSAMFPTGTGEAIAESNPISSTPGNYEPEQDTTNSTDTSLTSTDTALTNNDSLTDSDEGDRNERIEGNVGPLTQSALGKRLGCSANAVQQHRKQGKENLKVWSQKRDPDDYAWEYRSDKKYHPIVKL